LNADPRMPQCGIAARQRRQTGWRVIAGLFISQGVRGVCTSSSLDIEEADKQALVQAVGEQGDAFARTKELGDDPSEGFQWLVDIGLKLERELQDQEREVPTSN